MKISKTVLALALVVVVAAGAYAQTAEEIVDRHLEVTGGKEKQESIKTVKAVGTFALPAMGFEMQYTRIMKQPDKMRMDMTSQMGDMVQATDGEVAWGINPFMGQTEPTKMEGAEADMIKSQAMMDGFFFNREQNSVELEYVGVEEASGQKLHTVKVIMPSITYNAYFDVETGVMVKTVTPVEQQGQQMEAVSIFSDYRETNGIYSAHRIDQSAGGQEMVITIDELVYNEEYDDSLFAFPGK